MSGDSRKDAGQETADEVHPPCTIVEIKIEELDGEDDHGTELHGHGSSTNTINSKKVSEARSIKQRKESRGLRNQSVVESSRNQDRPPTPDADGQPRSDAALPYTKLPQVELKTFDAPTNGVESLRNLRFKMITFKASGDPAAVQGGAAAAANTGSGQGTPRFPIFWWSKKDSKN